ncbi:MAG TPA: hypothetical protein VFQ85_01785 [Mycobacteriales bacterium]|nr:hypothetical protein [Mycobacteriales bacterium]
MRQTVVLAAVALAALPLGSAAAPRCAPLHVVSRPVGAPGTRPVRYLGPDGRPKQLMLPPPLHRITPGDGVLLRLQISGAAEPTVCVEPARSNAAGAR